MFASLGRKIVRHPRRALVAWALITLVGALIALVGTGGGNLFDRLSTGEPSVTGSESAEGNRILAEHTTTGPMITMMVSDVDPAAAALPEAVETARTAVAAVPGVTSVVDPFALPDGIANPAAKPLLAVSGSGFIMVAELDRALDADALASAERAVVQAFEKADDAIVAAVPGATTLVGGTSLVVEAVTDQVKSDLVTGEVVALPVALIIMVLVFGGFLTASMPMVGAVASIGAGLGVIYGLTHVIDVDSSIVNVVSLLSIGLSIDYGLLIVSRYREELARARAQESEGGMRRRRGDGAVQVALVRTMSTAGRTVAFSALTVAISIAGLVVFEPAILRSIGLAGLAIVLISVATALTLVPALLLVAGARLERPGLLTRVPKLGAVLARTADVESDEGVFSRWAERVQRRPWWVLAGCVAVLAAMALPLGHLHLRNSGVDLLPSSDPQRVFVEQLASEYPATAGSDLVVIVEGTLEEAAAWATEIEALPLVTAVHGPSALGTYAVLAIDTTDDDAGGPDAVAAVHDLRELDPPHRAWVTGQTANQVDFLDALTSRAPWAVGIVVVATLVLLFLMTGSIVVPVKALLTNGLSLAASMGVLVLAFQDGWLEGLLGFASTGGIETYVFALVLAFAFGLAMDYEVFLLARIKELVDSGLDSEEAVRLGLQRSGRIITSAAAIIVVVFAGFIFGDLLVIKEVGFALAFAVALDATLVRMLLVPATMTLLGRYNWWAPAPLRRVHERFGLEH
ncbi:MMPL family transporter [Sanguibacter sp. HDW7]|uniref:MMPL family transporter n=1 Tax=Sanguibacter sp. HDW7 TaxID=2714931 RepID=UPI00140D932F|nr:MMPL family transporter [Sanguibacter sp. HDW7]QIK83594.1 MMPL family transporter [Sanguibacter sp. HDW7]